MIKFVIYGNPVPKGRPRFTKRGISYTPAKTRQAEENFLAQAIKYKPETPLTNALRIIIRIYKPKPKSKSKKELYWSTRPDLDNFIKAVLDPLNGVFWKDDSQVAYVEASKQYGEPARTEMEIYELN